MGRDAGGIDAAPVGLGAEPAGHRVEQDRDGRVPRWSIPAKVATS
jgi:hypothetical protein